MAMEAPHRPFSQYLRSRLSSAHEKATQNPFFRALFGNKLEKEQYVKMLESYWYLYSALETALAERAGDPALAPVYYPAELSRVAALERDLEFYTGSSKPRNQAGKVVAKYCGRVTELAKALGEEKDKLGAILLLPHSYVRYFADLSGGQMISEIVKRNYGLEGFRGREYYHFELIPDIAEFKKQYLAGLDGSAERFLTTAEREDAVIAEALRAYKFNDDLLTECMAGSGDAAQGMPSVWQSFRAFRKGKVVETADGYGVMEAAGATMDAGHGFLRRNVALLLAVLLLVVYGAWRLTGSPVPGVGF